MKALIWKIRYAMRIRKRSHMPLSFCWQCAESGMENLGSYWADEDPVDAADDELSCWSD